MWAMGNPFQLQFDHGRQGKIHGIYSSRGIYSLVVSIHPQCSIVGVYLPNGCLLALWGIFALWGYLPYGVSICSLSRYPALHLNTNRNLISCSLRRYPALNLNTNSGYLFSSWVFICLVVSIHLVVSIRLAVSICPQCSIVGVYLPYGCLLALWGIFASWGYLPDGGLFALSVDIQL